MANLLSLTQEQGIWSEFTTVKSSGAFSAPLALAIGLAGFAGEAVSDTRIVFVVVGALLLLTAFLSLVLLRGIDEAIYSQA
jgi:hypothetical protein